ncbi:MAG: SIS domain-containing protein [Ruminococcaceae bacterium]|nr:SIS domain-containing protein [Oscillospiraceae bacterium]
MINLEKEIREQPAVLASLKDKNIAVLKTLVEEIKEKNINNVYFVARGTSDHACIYAQYLFGIVLGIPCTLGIPSVVTQYNSEIKFNNSLVIGVSQSGRAEDVNAVLESANRQGITTLAITNYETSLLANTAKYHLFCNAGEEKSIAATKTFTSQMYLLALLCAEWSQNNELIKALGAVPSQIDEALNYLKDSIAEIVKSLLDYKEGVVLGRGLSYAIALEGALKILETNKMKVKGYPISDFYHGPVAQLHNSDLAIVLAQSGIMENDSIKMIEKLKAVGARTVIISDKEELLYGNHNIKISNTNSEFTIPFIFAIAVQMIALELVLAKGIDPDKSNVIAKITVTK